MDGSDEHLCELVTVKQRLSVKRPVFVDFERTGRIIRRHLESDKQNVAAKACPETHFWCSDKDHCLPVFVRCNGIFDCPGHEDERDCFMYTCPGFYRCRASKMCVHVSHVCDGWPQCPQHDDELLCARQCPLGCTCHGLAFFCSHAFVAHQFPDLRYLDVGGSGMNIVQLGDNNMLIHLSLARCRVKNVSDFTFYNLHSLDLSGNLLTEVSDHHFVFMPRLAILFLASNPLTSVFRDPRHTSINNVLTRLTMLDLSDVKTLSEDTRLVSLFPSLRILNFSHSGVELSQWNSSLEPVSSLREVDLRGCVTDEIPRDVLRGFLHLQLLHTDNFKLCCSSVLPPGFDLNHCHTTPDEVATCDDLLGSVVYRTMVGTLATLAVLGNVVSLIVRVCVRATWRLSSSGVVLTHLSVADLGMGLYLVTIALADRLLAGDYVWNDSSWRKGAVCHVASALSLSCRHATTFFVTILSLHRCLHHCWRPCPSLSPAKVQTVCVVVWAFSLLLSAVPLALQWRFLGQHGLCFPLPHTMIDAIESNYTYTVLVIVHFSLFVLCSVCEVVSRVCGTILKTRIMNTASCLYQSQFAVLGSLASGLLYTITCLVLASTHTDKQKAIHTALVYFGSIASCATNPYLYLYGVRAVHSKQIKEDRLLMIVNRAPV